LDIVPAQHCKGLIRSPWGCSCCKVPPGCVCARQQSVRDVCCYLVLKEHNNNSNNYNHYLGDFHPTVCVMRDCVTGRSHPLAHEEEHRGTASLLALLRSEYRRHIPAATDRIREIRLHKTCRRLICVPCLLARLPTNHNKTATARTHTHTEPAPVRGKNTQTC